MGHPENVAQPFLGVERTVRQTTTTKVRQVRSEILDISMTTDGGTKIEDCVKDFPSKEENSGRNDFVHFCVCIAN